MRKQKKLSDEAWGELIREQSGSAQSISAFCREHGLKEYSFYRHKRLIKEEASKAGGFRELVMPTGASIRVVVDGASSHIEVERGFDAALLREVVGALR